MTSNRTARTRLQFIFKVEIVRPSKRDAIRLLRSASRAGRPLLAHAAAVAQLFVPIREKLRYEYCIA